MESGQGDLVAFDAKSIFLGVEYARRPRIEVGCGSRERERRAEYQYYVAGNFFLIPRFSQSSLSTVPCASNLSIPPSLLRLRTG